MNICFSSSHNKEHQSRKDCDREIKTEKVKAAIQHYPVLPPSPAPFVGSALWFVWSCPWSLRVWRAHIHTHDADTGMFVGTTWPVVFNKNTYCLSMLAISWLSSFTWKQSSSLNFKSVQFHKGLLRFIIKVDTASTVYIQSCSQCRDVNRRIIISSGTVV